MATPQIFDRIQLRKPTKNKFNLSHSLLTTTNFGKLQPIQVLDCLPGDEVSIRHEFGVKLAPMIGPVMSEIDVKFFTFKVPYRIIWDDFEAFMSGGEEGTLVVNRPKINCTYPEIPATMHYLIEPGSLADALEFPTANVGATNPHKFVFDQLPFRAYWQIFNDYFIDQNLEEKYEYPKGSDDMRIGYGYEQADIARMMQMAHIAYKKDYFTSALPWTQRGPVAKIPIDIDNISIGKRSAYQDFIANNYSSPAALESWPVDSGAMAGPIKAGQGYWLGNLVAEDNTSVALRINNDNLYGYGANVSGTINDLRTMYAVQRWYERNALGGSRYIEMINAHFGVRSSDGRLQRAEFLGASTTPIIVNEVLQQSQTTTGQDGSPLGQPAGHGFGYNKGNVIKTFCEEHCWIITLMAVVPKAVYFQGMPRKYMRDLKEEFYWPEFAHLGEDEVYNGELKYLFTNSSKEADRASNKLTFGYQSRYADYKFSLNRIAGDFKLQPLESWHLARKFDTVPALNSDFIRVDADRDDLGRIWAYEASDFDHFWFNIYNHVYMRRPIPVFSTPI